MHYEKLSSQLVRALRGRRSQAALSRWLRFDSNVVCSWESGRRWPTASKWLWVCRRVGVEPAAALERFYRARPTWLDEVDPASRQGVARLLSDLKGAAKMGEVARRAGISRFAMARYLKGQAEPRLPEFLRVVDALSLRLLDFVAAFVDPAQLASVRGRWTELEATRQAAYELPWSHAVLRLLETTAYAELGGLGPGWLAERLQLSEAEVTACLEVLTAAGEIEAREGRYQVRESRTVDTQRDPEHGQRLKHWWARVALERLAHQSPGRFSYNLFTVSQADYERLEALQLAYFRELRSIVARSSPPERVALVNLQLLPLDVPAEGSQTARDSANVTPRPRRAETTESAPPRPLRLA